jgi:hypothetical protein
MKYMELINSFRVTINVNKMINSGPIPCIVNHNTIINPCLNNNGIHILSVEFPKKFTIINVEMHRELLGSGSKKKQDFNSK